MSEKFREYFKDELEAGEREARKQEQYEQITKMLSVGMTPSEIMRVTTYTAERIQEVQSSINQPA